MCEKYCGVKYEGVNIIHCKKSAIKMNSYRCSGSNYRCYPTGVKTV